MLLLCAKKDLYIPVYWPVDVGGYIRVRPASFERCEHFCWGRFYTTWKLERLWLDVTDERFPSIVLALRWQLRSIAEPICGYGVSLIRGV
jgi:hypothetical protein